MSSAPKIDDAFARWLRGMRQALRRTSITLEVIQSAPPAAKDSASHFAGVMQAAIALGRELAPDAAQQG